eukprot:jgi/Bigna1/126878/aug1.3_g1586
MGGRRRASVVCPLGSWVITLATLWYCCQQPIPAAAAVAAAAAAAAARRTRLISNGISLLNCGVERTLRIPYPERTKQCFELRRRHSWHLDSCVRSRERYILKTVLARHRTVMEPNMFPYDLPPGVEHWTLWSTVDLTTDEIESFVTMWLMKNLPDVRLPPMLSSSSKSPLSLLISQKNHSEPLNDDEEDEDEEEEEDDNTGVDTPEILPPPPLCDMESDTRIAVTAPAVQVGGREDDASFQHRLNTSNG